MQRMITVTRRLVHDALLLVAPAKIVFSVQIEFREGNGRTRRAFLAQPAHDAGYEPRWTAMDPAENTRASALSLAGDSSALHRVRLPRDQ